MHFISAWLVSLLFVTALKNRVEIPIPLSTFRRCIKYFYMIPRVFCPGLQLRLSLSLVE